MKTDPSEYSPAPEHRKIFKLSPCEDHVSLTAIKARTDCLRDTKLPYGARVLYCFLLDQALNPYVYITKGVVAISAVRLAEHLGCYHKTISKWTSNLEVGRHIWTDKQFMPNFWAMNRYHITAFDAQVLPSQLPTRDGMWGNGKRQGEAWEQDRIAARVVEKALEAEKKALAEGGGIPKTTPQENTAEGREVPKTTRQTSDENLQVIANQPPRDPKTTRHAIPKPPAARSQNHPPRRWKNHPYKRVSVKSKRDSKGGGEAPIGANLGQNRQPKSFGNRRFSSESINFPHSKMPKLALIGEAPPG